QVLGVKIKSLGRSTTHEGAGNGAHVGSLRQRLRTVDQSALGQLLPHGVDIQTQLALLQPLAYRGFLGFAGLTGLEHGCSLEARVAPHTRHGSEYSSLRGDATT